MTDECMLGSPKYKRIPGDFYPTPQWVTEILMGRVDLRDAVWEPACGEGHMSTVLMNGLFVYSSDISAVSFDHPGTDFLRCRELPFGVRSIVTNPPYSLAEEFVRHALRLTEPVGGQVCMLLNRLWDTAKTRKDLFEHPAFQKQIVITKRIQWIPGELKASPRQNHMWCVWDWQHTGPKTLEWA